MVINDSHVLIWSNKQVITLEGAGASTPPPPQDEFSVLVKIH